MILGMEWLEDFSPMWIDWKRKKMRFTYAGNRITLVGVKEQLDQCKPVTAKQLKGLAKSGAIAQLVQLCSLEEAKLDQQIPPEIQQVLESYKNRFQELDTLPPHRQFDHGIPLMPGTKPVNLKPYRYSPGQKDEIERQVKKILHQGNIKPSTSPFASPVLLVRKKDGTWRFCVDYRGLNEVMVKNKFPMPVVDELLDELAGAQWFTKLDMRLGYHQIRLLDEDEHKTAFKTHHFCTMLRKGVLVFVDDIMVYSSSLQEYVYHLQQVFELLQQHQLFVKASKCSFAQQQLEYLGHIIRVTGVATDPAKIQAVTDWPVPNTLKQLRGFLGLTGYYRKFIQHYGLLAKPLTNLLKKGVSYNWTSVEQEAFDCLKHALTHAPVLKLPDFQKEFVIETDASGKGIGAVLMQNGHPLAYISKALGSKSQSLSTYKKKCLAILLAIRKWRQYIQHNVFTIQTDHKSLIHLGEQ